MTGDEQETSVAKRDRDPIIMACLVVLLIASAAVLAVWVNNEYLSAGPSAAVGDTVEVEYTGSLYAPFGGEYAAVFDTSFWSVADDGSVLKSNSFTLKSESSYAPLSFVLGEGSYLTGFQNAIIGMKAGETRDIVINAGDGYESALTNYYTYSADHVRTVLLSETMAKSAFESLYGVTIASVLTDLTSPYGWPASAALDSTSNTVVVSYHAEAGATYVMAESGLGKVSSEVTSISSSAISYTMSVDEYVPLTSVTSGFTEIQMLEVTDGGRTVYIDGVTLQNGKVVSYQVKDVYTSSSSTTSAELYGETLYFRITLKSVSA
ncbi:MAG: FKBP-type peptidyl-prolyl cis-trans isomerase [Candidatus Methanomethylophilaceae archaeon]|jgi:hypothetical protein|nr:FKBP-type peptidyl-prolyl cis-trans isomerase [Candidatus Methanomethylophilaceae archaeon]